jgi:hypothetical protein
MWLYSSALHCGIEIAMMAIEWKKLFYSLNLNTKDKK